MAHPFHPTVKKYRSFNQGLVLHDRFGHPVKPKEWFLIPLQVIDEAVKRIRDGSITDYVYDPKKASLILAAR